MIQLYNKISEESSKTITNVYSTSFSLGIKLFKPELRQPIYNIYGFVRIADEIVDTFHDYDKSRLLQKFREDTFEAIEMGISTNPVLNSFQQSVNKFNIDLELIDAFLKSMEMDLSISSHEKNSYDEYVNGSAEVVGLMCLKVFTQNNSKMYSELKPSAEKLGSAFQKVNFLRDLKDDIEERGRIYLPGVHKENEINDFNKNIFEKEIDEEFNEAHLGIMKLPFGVRLGVYLAYIYYLTLYRKLKGKSVEEIKTMRVRVPNFVKILLLVKSYFTIRIFKRQFVEQL